MQLLAPARNIQVAKAAIQAGADAVYIGAPMFGARQAAGNNLNDIGELCRYAHLFGVEVLITLNTLLTPDERAQAAEMAWQLWNLGADALIVQDMQLLQQDLPPIRLHASTQCDNRTAEQVIRLQQSGFKRAVLARELSIEQIRQIRQATLKAQPDEPIELEVFVHGALCVSYSGRCFMSERLMGRSANRGECAQMCRMRYDLLDKNLTPVNDRDGQPITQRYLLSLKDMDRSQSLRELKEAGVHTLKIEGRLKDEAYVTNIVAYYRQLLDRQGLSEHPEMCVQHHFTPAPEKTFHRDQTEYFLHGRTPRMANWDTPKSTGEPIGTVIKSQGCNIFIRLREGISLHNGDGLCYGDKGFQINSVQPQQPDSSKGSGVHITTFHAQSVPVGTLLYRNQDTVFLKSLHSERHIPLSLRLDTDATGFTLTAATHNRQVARHFDFALTPATNAERAQTTLREQLSKLGDTCFVAKEVVIPETAYFVPISVVNSWRRDVVEALNSESQQTQRVTLEGMSERICSTAASLVNFSETSYKESEGKLMTCKYCILHELGRCRKKKNRDGVGLDEEEPKYLRLANGTILQLHFDCKNCEMTITT